MRFTFLILLFCVFQHISQAGERLSKKDPELNFEKFWQIFDRNYAHFENRKIDWQQQYQSFRPAINRHTTDEQLLTALNEMVAPLKDGHVVISPTGDLAASAKYSRFFQEFPTKDLQAKFHEVTLDNLQKQGFGPFKKFQSEPYQIGGYCRSANFGYIQINGFGGMPIELFTKQLDEMVHEFADVKALIIDIRINGGGSPAYLNALVGRLTQVKRLVGYGRTRTGKPKNDFTSWTAYQIAPQGTKQLVKPTILLTSGATISAGDHCAMYLKEFPYVRQIGENTNGIFSSMHGERLPNGWHIALSNGQTVSSKRISYEGVGVPVDVLALHSRTDMLTGKDAALAKAFAYLEINQPTLAKKTICHEQIALNYYADSLLINKTYGDITAYSNGLVEEDATLLAPFSKKCNSLQSVYKSDGLETRIKAEEFADSTFHRQNIAHRFYVRTHSPIRAKRRWPFAKRNGRRLTIAHHINIADKNYVRLHLSQGGWKGETVLVVVNNQGTVVEHCFLSYDYLSRQFYQ
ncbi:S41 family peptidase [Dyadobacter aurulentus]|uniref:S41 family peptidase n=1 Tax=Dyadobacter sp. UC 10 TaxID=2605428 RepID=UPI0011F28819|nr:S41 family peptidase [Dyadobacter sp. UC 10]KAA0988833.1 S41 family peptidase [Dyadobacter sp. UC 10]